MRHMLVAGVALLLLLSPVWAQEPEPAVDSLVVDTTIDYPAPVSMLSAEDKDNDHGHAVVLTWVTSPDDGGGYNNVLSYEIFRWVPFLSDSLSRIRGRLTQTRASLDNRRGDADSLRTELRELRERFEVELDRFVKAHASYPEGGEWRSVGIAPAGATSFEHSGAKERLSQDFVPDYTDLYYRVDAVTADTLVRTASDPVGPVQCYGQWFNSGRKPVLAAVLIFGLATLLFVTRARSGADLYVRPIGGIEAVDEAIGRATEMGRPILYVLGLGSAADVATIASFTILGRVAKQVAEYQTQLIVPTYDPIVMSVAQEVVKSSFLDAGRPDAYNDDIVFFVTQSQFAYVAAVNGIMLRELPATNVYMGKFFAESLILAETGALAQSIQIAGTDEIAQIPFFIVACDYTLIGEELYAASAYLGREPILLGSLKAQDLAKAAVLIFAIMGLVAANFDWLGFTELFHVTD